MKASFHFGRPACAKPELRFGEGRAQSPPEADPSSFKFYK